MSRKIVKSKSMVSVGFLLGRNSRNCLKGSHLFGGTYFYLVGGVGALIEIIGGCFTASVVSKIG